AGKIGGKTVASFRSESRIGGERRRPPLPPTPQESTACRSSPARFLTPLPPGRPGPGAPARPSKDWRTAMPPRPGAAPPGSPTRLSYQDKDGDNVTVTFSKPILTAANVNTVFTFDSGAGAVNGSNAAREQLQKIDLTAVAGAAGTTITTNATRSAVNGGDGFPALGRIDASGVDPRAGSNDGDLGQVLAGDATTSTSGLKGLTVQSLGRFGTSTGADDLTTAIQGQLDFLRVKTDFKDAIVQTAGNSDGKIGSVTIGG